MTHSIDGSVNDLARRRGFAELVEKVKQGSGVDTTGVAANTFFGSHGWPCHAPGLVNNYFLSCWEELKGARTPQNKGSLICAPGQKYLSKGKQKKCVSGQTCAAPVCPTNAGTVDWPHCGHALWDATLGTRCNIGANQAAADSPDHVTVCTPRRYGY